MSLSDRALGCLLGLATGDALGTTLEFCPRDSYPALTDMVGGGPFQLQPGQWTDDTSMALCLADSLLAVPGFDPADQMQRYLNWYRLGERSSTGQCFDVGCTVEDALLSFAQNQKPYAGSTDPYSAGNGSLMRLAPIALYYHRSLADTLHYAELSSLTTHGAPEAVETCVLFAWLLNACLYQTYPSIQQLLTAPALRQLDLQCPKLQAIAQADYLTKTRAEINSSGYVVDSLEAALWCLAQTNSFDQAVLMAANLGDDADTVAAICGQIAGAWYGLNAINPRWRKRLYLAAELQSLAKQLIA